MLKLKRLILNSCKSGNVEYFIYPKDKYPSSNFIELLNDMKNENLRSIKGSPAIGACYIQVTDYGLDFLE